MDRTQVNVYIEVSIRGPAVREGAYLYVLEYMLHDQPVTRCGYCRHESTENQLTLEALIRASERVRKPAEIRVFTHCGYVFNAIRNGWPQEWKAAGWKTAKGKPVKNVELWDRLLCGEQPHIFTATEQDHSYREWMLSELERKEKDHVGK
ncbi:MAG TPA: hypothetical protein H9761_17115 [Candidatus Eisenbergiella merdavium]|uniref:RNase H type-1 domain-containing protein n=1 Tax=Candidatus Eisenbergiella merdavium TaxID=2838551 RepID=A0A9D2NH46_9FIRM|nr:hypothetical protein [Candidatus Eisenbergiella merdavium]